MNSNESEPTPRDVAVAALRALAPDEVRAVVREIAGEIDADEAHSIIAELLKAVPDEAARGIVRAVVGPLAGDRRVMPNRRRGISQKARIDKQTLYLHTGEFDDGTLGEIFIRISKDGESFGSLMNCFAIAVSLGLQHGVTLETYVQAFTFTKFEPYGMVTQAPAVRMAMSPLDYVFRVLGIDYLGRVDLAHDPADLVGNEELRAAA